MPLTRKEFITRAALGTAAFAATTLVGSGSADAGAQPHMRSVIALLDNASRQLDAISEGWSAPDPPDQPAVIAELQAIVAASTHIGAVANALLLTMPR